MKIRVEELDLDWLGDENIWHANIVFFLSAKTMRNRMVKDNVNFTVHDDTIAGCDCFKTGVCVANLYFLDSSTIDDVAHEATHLALGILARQGIKSIKVTAEKAPEEEEKLAYLVGRLTSKIKNFL